MLGGDGKGQTVSNLGSLQRASGERDDVLAPRRLSVPPSRAPSSSSGQAQDERTGWPAGLPKRHSRGLGNLNSLPPTRVEGRAQRTGPRATARRWRITALDSGSGAGMTGWARGHRGVPLPVRSPIENLSTNGRARGGPCGGLGDGNKWRCQGDHKSRPYEWLSSSVM